MELTTPELVLLDSGKVLVVGGSSSSRKIELYDPTAGTFAYAGEDLDFARNRPAVAKLSNGKVLIAGGSNADNGVLASAELYDPTENTLTPTGNLNTARAEATAHRITAGTHNGKVYLLGGRSGSINGLGTIDVYDPSAGTFSLMSTELTTGFLYHTSALLSGKRVLVVGGKTGITTSNILDTTIGALVTFTASGGSSPYTYSVTSGTGTIEASSGKLAVPFSTQDITVKVTDNAGTTATKVLSVTMQTP